MKKLFFGIFAISLSISSIAQNIAIDVGHFTAKPGAISAFGETELMYNQLMAVNLREALSKTGFKAKVNGLDGNLSNFAERVRQGAGNDFFLSIHHDSVQEYDLTPWDVSGTQQRYTTKANGFSVFVSQNAPHYKKSLFCARAIANSLVESGFKPNFYHHYNNPKGNFQLLYNDLSVYNFNKLLVLKNNPVPAVLLEAGVILSPQEAMAFKDNIHRSRFATATAKGLKTCLAN